MIYTTREFRKNLRQALDAAGDNGGVYISRRDKKYILLKITKGSVNIDPALDVIQTGV